MRKLRPSKEHYFLIYYSRAGPKLLVSNPSLYFTIIVSLTSLGDKCFNNWILRYDRINTLNQILWIVPIMFIIFYNLPVKENMIIEWYLLYNMNIVGQRLRIFSLNQDRLRLQSLPLASFLILDKSLVSASIFLSIMGLSWWMS